MLKKRKAQVTNMIRKIEINESDYKDIIHLLEKKVQESGTYNIIKKSVELTERIKYAWDAELPRLEKCICSPQCSDQKYDCNNCEACVKNQIPF